MKQYIIDVNENDEEALLEIHDELQTSIEEVEDALEYLR